MKGLVCSILHGKIPVVVVVAPFYLILIPADGDVVVLHAIIVPLILVLILARRVNSRDGGTLNSSVDHVYARVQLKIPD